jgi:hypothetical protein
VTEAIFLSASVPDPKRSPKYAGTADTVAITAAVGALVYVTLGRRMLVWGGHPAITPMVWAVAKSLEVDYDKWVKLYQSRYFEDEFPEDNERFQNVTFTDAVKGDRADSLRFMRERMFQEQNFEAAVFIGGMEGIVEEFDLFTELQPRAEILPIVSTGGAAIDVADRLKSPSKDLRDDLDYVSLFHRRLGIAPREQRYDRPSSQPPNRDDRLWVAQRKNGPLGAWLRSLFRTDG